MHRGGGMDDEWQEIAFDLDGFEWDENKAQSNFKKHDISFYDAVEIFERPLIARLQIIDFEERYEIIGLSRRASLCVICTERTDALRIISARKATEAEERRYRAYFFQRLA